eukprot:Protomagalhaensia_wolfi_Nauph_80__404@NODE_1223_length_1648_cov_202_423244_g941_i0_p2_GENE_NODE_1223_length_1648_cov_202_423244_g941_i0NODE_1223_length_1648_cov_202_423244_g941_i0_p2_ORF_typecomplete_len182_score46_10TCTP/PF00838_17/2e28DUF469/PF04320_14/3_6e02DUF469/PF04320_14/0_93_NODE_1223_length_1648_cov_202_423244_g941_i0189734
MVEVYTDKKSGKDVCSDAYRAQAPFDKEEFNLVAFEVKARMRVKGQEDYGISANVDEDAEAGTSGAGGDSTEERVVDLVDAFQLMDSGLDKKLFQAYIMNYVKKVLTPEMKAEDVNAWKAALSGLVKEMLSRFKDAEIYFCESYVEADDPSVVMPIYSYWVDGEDAPRFIYFKDGLKSQKY